MNLKFIKLPSLNTIALCGLHVVLTACVFPTAQQSTPAPVSAPSLGISANYFGRADQSWNSCENDDLSGATLGYDSYILGDLIQPSADTEGRLAVGGNAKLATYSVGAVLTPDPTRIDLLVNGNLDFSSGNVVNGRAVYGGTVTTSSLVSYYGGISQENHASEFASAASAVKAMSILLGKFRPNGAVTADFSNGQARSFTDLTGYDSTLNVFAMGVDDLKNTHTFRINAPSGSSAVINIYGTHGVVSSFGMQLTGITRDHILFNFVDATELEISEVAVEGSVLAPLASVSFPYGMVNGQFVGGSATGAGQFNINRFTGCLPHQIVTSTPTPTATPVPTATPTPAPVIACGTANDWANYNVLVWDNFTASGSDTEGRMAIGGNASLSSYAVGAQLSHDATRYDLIVGGSLSFIGGSIYSGSVAYGASATVQNASVFGSVTNATPLNFTALKSSAITQSTALAALAANGTTLVQDYGGPSAQITLTGTDPVRNVFTLSGTDLNRANTFNINAPSGSSVVVNVSGTADQMKNFGFNISGIARERVLFNFPSATTLSLEGIGVQGSILAPNAAVTFTSGQANGSIVAKSLNGNGQINYAQYTGCVPLN